MLHISQIACGRPRAKLKAAQARRLLPGVDQPLVYPPPGAGC
jgi:hypothetical protein